MNPTPPPFSIRTAELPDSEAIRQIYNHYVLHSTCTFQIEPDTETERLVWLRDRAAAHPVVVAVDGGEVIGWGALSRWKERAAYDHSVEGSIYVCDGWQRRGVGRALLEELIRRARALGHHTLIGGACTEHVPSLKLQESLGFRQVAHLREVGYKFGRWLDVIYMQLML